MRGRETKKFRNRSGSNLYFSNPKRTQNFRTQTERDIRYRKKQARYLSPFFQYFFNFSQFAHSMQKLKFDRKNPKKLKKIKIFFIKKSKPRFANLSSPSSGTRTEPNLKNVMSPSLGLIHPYLEKSFINSKYLFLRDFSFLFPKRTFLKEKQLFILPDLRFRSVDGCQKQERDTFTDLRRGK